MRPVRYRNTQWLKREVTRLGHFPFAVNLEKEYSHEASRRWKKESREEGWTEAHSQVPQQEERIEGLVGSH